MSDTTNSLGMLSGMYALRIGSPGTEVYSLSPRKEKKPTPGVSQKQIQKHDTTCKMKAHVYLGPYVLSIHKKSSRLQGAAKCRPHCHQLHLKVSTRHQAAALHYYRVVFLTSSDGTASRGRNVSTKLQVSVTPDGSLSRQHPRYFS